jgi:hypothetical protein
MVVTYLQVFFQHSVEGNDGTQIMTLQIICRAASQAILLVTNYIFTMDKEKNVSNERCR